MHDALFTVEPKPRRGVFRHGRGDQCAGRPGGVRPGLAAGGGSGPLARPDLCRAGPCIGRVRGGAREPPSRGVRPHSRRVRAGTRRREHRHGAGLCRCRARRCRDHSSGRPARRSLAFPSIRHRWRPGSSRIPKGADAWRSTHHICWRSCCCTRPDISRKGSAGGDFVNGSLTQLNIEPSRAKAAEENADQFAADLIRKHANQVSKSSLQANFIAVQLSTLSWNMQAFISLDQFGATALGTPSVSSTRPTAIPTSRGASCV